MQKKEIAVKKLAVEDVAGISYKLTPLSMLVPNSEGICAPSRLQEPKRLSWLEFTSKYTAKEVLVSFEPDGVSDPQLMTVYGFGLDCWYLVEFEVQE